MKKWLLPFFETFMVFIFLGCCLAIPIILVNVYAASYFYIIENTELFDFLYSTPKDDQVLVVVVLLLASIFPTWYFASRELFYQYQKMLSKIKKSPPLIVNSQCSTGNCLGKICSLKKLITYKMSARICFFCRRALSILFFLFQTGMCLMAFIYLSGSKNLNNVLHASSEIFIIYLAINYTLITHLTLKGIERCRTRNIYFNVQSKREDN